MTPRPLIPVHLQDGMHSFCRSLLAGDGLRGESPASRLLPPGRFVTTLGSEGSPLAGDSCADSLDFATPHRAQARSYPNSPPRHRGCRVRLRFSPGAAAGPCPNGAQFESPGQRPGDWPRKKCALKGREDHGDDFAPPGLVILFRPVPGALPRAFKCRPCGADIRRAGKKLGRALPAAPAARVAAPIKARSEKLRA